MTATERVLAHFDRISEAPEAISRLRRFVLDLAVRGELVPQDPSDEPASELAERIQAAKRAAGVRACNRVTIADEMELPFPAPDGWAWVRIGQITGDRGQVIPSESFTYIDVTSIDKEVGRIADPKVLQADDAPSRARKSAQNGDVLYSCVRPYLLNVAVIDRDFTPPPIASTAFAVLNGFGLVVPRYLWIALRSPAMVAQVESKMRGQAYPAINDSDFKALRIPLPPLAEQHRIVAKVDELMALCDRLEAAQKERERRRDRLVSASLARLNQSADSHSLREHARFHLEHLPRTTTSRVQIQQLRQTVLDLAAHGRLVPQRPDVEADACTLLARLKADIHSYCLEHGLGAPKPTPLPGEAPFRAPIGWAWTRLCTLFRVITDGDHLPPPKSDDGVAFLTIGNVTTGRLDFTGCRFVPQSYFDRIAPYRRPSRGDILYTVVGATFGRPVPVNSDRSFCVQRHIAILKPALETNARFIAILLASPMIYDQAKRSLTGTAQPTVPLRPLRDFLVCVPPLKEQQRIVAKVDELMAVCDHLEAQIEDAAGARRRLFESVLREALAPAV